MSEEYLKLDRDYKTALEVVKELRQENTRLSNNLDTAYITLKKIIEKQDKKKELIDKIKEMFSEENINSYYYDNGDNYEFAIDDFEEDILDLIKEYENND